MDYTKYVKIEKEIDNNYAIASNKGYKFKIRKNKIDAFTCKEVFGCGYFKHLELDKNDVVIDVGANIGVFAIAAADKCREVIAFEPDPANYRLAQENIQLNKIKNIRLIHGAVAEHNGDIELYLNSGVCSDCHSTFKIRGRKSIKVKAISLNDIISRYNPNKLKIDCEGEELKFMRTANMNNIRNLAMEVHFTYSKRDKHENYYKCKSNIEKYFNKIKYPKVQDKFSKMMFAKKI